MIYLDYNATTPVEKRVLKAMLPYLETYHGNPSSGHAMGLAMKQAITESRQKIASLIGATPDEIVFNSGGSESNNYCLKGVALSLKSKGNHFVTTAIEHPAIINPLRQLEKLGFEYTAVGVDGTGQVDPDDIRNAITPNTILVTVMHANNEVGTIQPISDISRVCGEAGVWLHTDAAQSIGKIPVNVNDLGVDFLTVAGHKIYAPAGIGALYIRNGIDIEPLILGAGHENGRRAGTEPTASIAAVGEACQIAPEAIDNPKYVRQRDRMFETLQNALGDHVKLNGHESLRLPNTVNIGFVGLNGAEILSRCPDIAASPGGAACHGQRPKPSTVLSAMGVPESQAIGAVRFSVGRMTTDEEVERACKQLITAVNDLS